MKLSTSRASTWFRCPRAFKHEYVDRRITRDVSPQLSFGTAWHALMEARWKNEPLPDVYDPSQRVGKHETAVLMAGYQAYDDLYQDDTKYTVLDCEKEHERDIEGVTLRWRFDALVQQGSDVFLVEHKTTSSDISAGSFYWEKLTLDQQVSWYFLAAKALGYTLSGVIYDVFRKPALRRKKTENSEAFTTRCMQEIIGNPGKYFAREMVYRSTSDLERAAENLQDVVPLVTLGRYPQNPNACFQFGRRCEYHDVCTGAASITDDNLFMDKDE